MRRNERQIQRGKYRNGERPLLESELHEYIFEPFRLSTGPLVAR
jgi:hypothetical protein